VGSTGIKIVFLDAAGNLRWKKVLPTKPGQSGVVRGLIGEGLEYCGIGEGDIGRTCVTGYGRNLIDSKDTTIDEITANAAGIYRLTDGAVRTLINIGGQDVKIIKLSDTGQVLDFRMNDKCAAGTGRFFEIAAKILDISLEGFYLSDDVEPVGINATCAVFAESEIVSLLAKGTDRQRIIQGINTAVARRIASLAGSGLLAEPVYVDGGPARNLGLIECLEDALMCDIHVTDHPQFTVAMGAVFV
ncbi:MAG: acyl-CoA dehydratase activase, partial [Desulfobacterales bacterium]|nr:acyl-CoA dehydratase activase [Desulfobacterales bacterium]